MKTIKGPAIFLAQFMGAEEPYNNLKSICTWAKGLGYKGVQIPIGDTNYFDVKKAAQKKGGIVLKSPSRPAAQRTPQPLAC